MIRKHGARSSAGRFRTIPGRSELASTPLKGRGYGRFGRSGRLLSLLVKKKELNIGRYSGSPEGGEPAGLIKYQRKSKCRCREWGARFVRTVRIVHSSSSSITYGRTVGLGQSSGPGRSRPTFTAAIRNRGAGAGGHVSRWYAPACCARWLRTTARRGPSECRGGSARPRWHGGW